ncbi:MAG0920 family protein [Mycoplasmopsis felifaucium]|uniref:Transmembrane protein n=1 Tax=Mycoplasmopsis felifaucium TaxID=35768 RepID=A0ABZ2RQ72_9BACT|nr:hypothetical protein [Mycoplasmopsis felifaucium]
MNSFSIYDFTIRALFMLIIATIITLSIWLFWRPIQWKYKISGSQSYITELYRIQNIKVNTTVLNYFYNRLKITISIFLGIITIGSLFQIPLFVMNLIKYKKYYYLWIMLLAFNYLWYLINIFKYRTTLKDFKQAIRINNIQPDDRLIENISKEQYNHSFQVNFSKNNCFVNVDSKTKIKYNFWISRISKRVPKRNMKIYWKLIINVQDLFLKTSKQYYMINYGSFYKELKNAGWI